MKKTFKEIASLWMKEKKAFIKRSTYAIYSLNLEKHILPHFGNHHRITENEVQQFVLKKMESGLSANTIKDIVTLLKTITRYGQAKKWTTYTQWTIRYPQAPRQNAVKVFSVVEQKRLMSHLKNNFSFRNLGILICLNTGLRIGEICALKWCDIDLAQETLHIRRTLERIYLNEDGKRYSEIIINSPKTTNSTRDIPLSKELICFLRPLKKIVNDNYYVISNSVKPMEPHAYRSYYNTLIGALDLPKLNFHCLRHSFATRCIESGCDYKTVSVLLGHSSVSITLNTYVHPNQEQKKRCINQMMRILN